MYPKIMDTANSMVKTAITFKFIFSCKAPLLPMNNAKPIHPLNHAWLKTQKNRLCVCVFIQSSKTGRKNYS